MGQSPAQWRKQLEDWLAPRKWSIGFYANGHLKLEHPDIPIPLPASQSPSCKFAFDKVKALVRRTEKSYGLSYPEHGRGESAPRGRPATEAFQSSRDLRSTTFSCCCSKCGAQETLYRADSEGPLAIPKVAAEFRKMGWQIKIWRRDDVCPSCVAEMETVEIERAKVKNGSNGHAVMDMPRIKLPNAKAPDIGKINLEALIQQQLTQKRKVAAALSKVYLPDIGYLPGESDKSVAARTSAAIEVVEKVRAEFYGALKQASPLTLLKRAVIGYRRNLKAFETDVIEKVAKLEADAGTLLKWLDQIDERSVPPMETEEEQPAPTAKVA